ncbi:hypothetical protein IFR05_002595 [Cadophora sp. M221]|nr:hypothetical protein IFR05_002595 [Cadophora sp. M221]
MIRPFKVIWYPLILWSGIVYGSCVCWLSVQAVTIASIFSAPPYLFRPDQIGLLALESVIGTIFGSLYSGYLTNAWVLRLTRRNGGFREPEYRIYSLIPGAFFIYGGLLMYGLGSGNGVHGILPAFGSGCIAVGLAVGGAIMMGFVIGCYKQITADAITCVIVIRNTMGFAITFGTIDWISAQGLQNTFITMGLLAFTVFMSGIVVIMFGKKLRVLAAKSYLAFAEKVE